MDFCSSTLERTQEGGQPPAVCRASEGLLPFRRTFLQFVFFVRAVGCKIYKSNVFGDFQTEFSCSLSDYLFTWNCEI